MTEYLYEGFGAEPIPPTLTSGAVTAVELDPARAILAGLFTQVLKSELGAAWTQVIAALSSNRFSGTTPVEDTLEIKPNVQLLQSRKQKLPLLAVYRKGRATFEEFTISKDKITQPWEVVWIIGQATIEEQRKLADFLIAGAKTIRLAVERRGHPDYDSAALQFFPTTGGLGSLTVDWCETEPVRLENSEMDWLILRMGLTSVEYGKWDSGAFVSADYATFDLGVGDSTGIVPSFINADSRYPEGDPRP